MGSEESSTEVRVLCPPILDTQELDTESGDPAGLQVAADISDCRCPENVYSATRSETRRMKCWWGRISLASIEFSQE